MRLTAEVSYVAVRDLEERLVLNHNPAAMMTNGGGVRYLAVMGRAGSLRWIR
jgi:hypothetical protein